MRNFKSRFIILATLALSFAFIQNAYSQNICNQFEPCQSDADCQDFSNSGIPAGGCPSCMGCVEGQCQPKDSLCDDGSDCTDDFCVFDIDFDPPASPNGCEYIGLATLVPPDPNLPIECYICEPTANNVLVDNGICDEAAGETCVNSTDCQVAGVPCGPPPPPPLGCDPTQNTPDPLCQDGDRCTADICTIVGLSAPTAECSNPPLTCQPFPDGCCPADCDGPDPSPEPGTEPCLDVTGAPIPGCDADCWYPQVCGDGQVQPPETCDDSADQGDAGISPTGAIVSNETCRDAGTPAECTYCGDGILQEAAGEQCDLNQEGACGGEGCDLTTCQCNTANLCLTGSGNIWDTVRTDCADCSLNPFKRGTHLGKDYGAWMILGSLLLGGLWFRHRLQA